MKLALDGCSNHETATADSLMEKICILPKILQSFSFVVGRGARTLTLKTTNITTFSITIGK
jgi:hypothetical protein